MDADKTCELLNRLLWLDARACTAIMDHRVECNEDLSDDPDIVVLADPGEPLLVGTVGVINGLLRYQGDERRIAAHYEDDGTLFKFGVQD